MNFFNHSAVVIVDPTNNEVYCYESGVVGDTTRTMLLQDRITNSTKNGPALYLLREVLANTLDGGVVYVSPLEGSNRKNNNNNATRHAALLLLMELAKSWGFYGD